MWTFLAQNFRVLRRLTWPLHGASVLTGANGAGKTTALLGLKTLRAAYEWSLPEAVSLMGGSYNLRNHQATEGEPIELGLQVGDLSWRVRLIPRAATVDHLTDESLMRGDQTIFVRDSLGNFFYRGDRQELSAAAAERLGLRWVAEAHPDDEEAGEMADIVRRIQVFHDPDLRGLREGGSRATEDRHMHSSGRNVLTMLRKWRDRKADNHRFHFVDDGLKAAFPRAYAGIDFESSGQTISAQIYRPGDDSPTPLNHEANGLLAMMILLAQLASADPGGLIAIDEAESSLHPFAIRSLVRRARAFARQQDLGVVLTTHSPVLLDEFNAEPEQIFVLEGRPDEPLPVRLDKLRSREWLASYTLGELYAGGEFAANEKV